MIPTLFADADLGGLLCLVSFIALPALLLAAAYKPLKERFLNWVEPGRQERLRREAENRRRNIATGVGIGLTILRTFFGG